MSATEPLQLVVGLGNPGKEYAQTRHNAGFWFVEALAAAYHEQFRTEPKFKAELAALDIAGHKVRVLKPLTYMNLSGQSVLAVSRFYKIPLGAVLVVHDDLDLEVGTIKLKWSGGHGGHNGLRDISQKMGKDYWRLRIGVSHPGDKHRVTDFVLGRPSQADRQAMEQAIDKGLRAIEDIVNGETQAAMQYLHSK